jgi:hypothetical protein
MLTNNNVINNNYSINMLINSNNACYREAPNRAKKSTLSVTETQAAQNKYNSNCR